MYMCGEGKARRVIMDEIDELERCLKNHTGNATCCEHIRAVLDEMRKQIVYPEGELQASGLACKACTRMHYF